MGEDLASRHLIDQGYVILEKNYRRGNLEIDLIALDGNELVVAEVKTRSEGTLLRPETAVDHRKRKALMKLANEYMKSHQREEDIRFDIISIINTEHGPHIDHIKASLLDAVCGIIDDANDNDTMSSDTLHLLAAISDLNELITELSKTNEQ